MVTTALDFASPGPVTGRYRLVVDQYWFIKQQCRNGEPLEAGDCSWCIHYYPNGRTTSGADYISVFVALAGGRSSADAAADEPVKARVSFSLLDRAGEPVPGHSCSGVCEYPELDDCYGCDLFIHKDFLESSPECLVDDDRLTIECVVSVERAHDLQQRLSLDPDVVFQVGGEAFSVHGCVLAAKSPVFEAELAATGRRRCCIQIDDMLPQVFKSMLHFVYTDSLPEATTAGPEEESIMAERLLVAADRFDMQELKQICGEILSSDIHVNTVTEKLRLAVQHQCHTLRDACIQFLEDPPVLQAVMAVDDDILELVAKNCPLLLKEMWAYEDDPMQDALVMCF